MSDENAYQPGKQVEGAPPVVENPKLPSMEDAEPRPKRIKGEILMMPDKPGSQKGAKNMMGAPSVKGAAKKSAKGGDLPPQQPIKGSGKTSEKYLRLRVRVENGQMSVIDGHEVAGPLAEPTALPGSYAYEVTLGSQRLHAGSLPDLNVVRSFPNPNGPPAEQTHHTYEVPIYEFNVRVPSAAISASTLPQTEIALYRVKEPVRVMSLGRLSLADVHERELREVARMKGIPATIVSQAAPAGAAFTGRAVKRAAKKTAAKASAKKAVKRKKGR
jgi:hypothetical protein